MSHSAYAFPPQVQICKKSKFSISKTSLNIFFEKTKVKLIEVLLCCFERIFVFFISCEKAITFTWIFWKWIKNLLWMLNDSFYVNICLIWELNLFIQTDTVHMNKWTSFFDLPFWAFWLIKNWWNRTWLKVIAKFLLICLFTKYS